MTRIPKLGVWAAAAALFAGGLAATVPGALAEDAAPEAPKVATECVGAGALVAGCKPNETGMTLPSVEDAKDDMRGNAYHEGCWSDVDFKTFRSCSFGSKTARHTVAVVGNSHVAQFLGPFREWTVKHDLRVVSYTIPKCHASTRKLDFNDAGLTQRCHEWGKWVHRKTLALKPDLIVTAERTNWKPVNTTKKDIAKVWQKGHAEYLKKWTDKGIHVLVIRDTPTPGKSVPACIKKNPKKYSACAGKREVWLQPDALVAAAREDADARRVSVVDLTRYMCTAKKCPAVIGGLLVYRDHSHLSATWVRSLQIYLEQPFLDALRRSQKP